MKIIYLISFLGLVALSCNSEDDDSACATPLTIREVIPPANPVGYEVLIRGEGLADAGVDALFGDGTAAPAEWNEELQGLVTTVPSGLPSFTELVVRRGNCLARTNFEVYADFPADVPANLSTILVPAPPVAIPSSLQNAWPNAADLSHSIFLVPDGDNPGQWVPGQNPCPDACSTEFQSDPGSPFNGNPISGTFDTTTLEVTLYVDRTANGLGLDTLEGQFVDPNTVITTGSEVGILLFSRKFQKQLLFLYP